MNSTSNIQNVASPYKGLAPYDITDKDNFFGREREAQILIGKLFSYNVTLLFAGTGVGKSSLLRAAVIPVLMGKSGLDVVYYADWVREPVEGLKGEVRKTLMENEKISGRELKGVEELHPFLETCTAYSSEPLILMLDQFEELFRYHAQSGRLTAFIEQIVGVINDKDLPLSVVFAIREDFLAELNVFKGRIPGLFDNYYRLERLRISQARDAIAKPAQQAGFSYQAGLVDKILQDLTKREQAGQSGMRALQRPDEGQEHFVEPPYLQIVCQKLWQQDYKNPQKMLTLNTYEALEGAENIVRAHVESVMGELTLREQSLAFEMFQYLVTSRGTKMAYRDEDLADTLGVPQKQVRPILEHLEQARILRRDNRPDGLWYELYHDVFAEIIRSWTEQFQGEQDRYIYSQITTAVREWKQQGEDENALLKGGLLSQAEEWGKEKQHEEALSVDEQTFLKLSLKKYYRGVWLRRGIVAVITLFAIIATVGVWYANKQKNEAEYRKEQAIIAEENAEKAQQKAERQTRIAQARQLAAQAQVTFDKYPQRSLLLAIEAIKSTVRQDEPRVPEAEQALRDVLAKTGGIGLSGHEGWITAVAVSPDNRYLITGSDDNTARLWDLQAEDVAQSAVVLRGHEGAIRAVAVSPDNRYLITGSRDDTARLWDLQAEDVAQSAVVLREHEGAIDAVAVSPDNRYLITGSQDRTARLWDLQAENVAASAVALRGHEGAIDAVAVSPDNRYLITGSRDGTARLWELQAENVADSAVVLHGHEGAIYAVAVSPDNRYLITGSGDRTARLWDLQAEDVAASAVVLRGHEDTILALVVSPDNRYLITSTSSWDRTARLWDLQAEDVAASAVALRGHEGPIWAVAVSPDNRYLITGRGDGTARLWDLQAEDVAASAVVLRGHEGPIWAVAVSPDSRYLITGSFDDTARLWDLQAEDVADSAVILRGHEWGIGAVAVSPDSRYLITGSGDNTARLWDLQAEDVAQSAVVLRGHKGAIRAVAVSPDTRYLITGSGDTTVRLWDLQAEDVTDSAVVLRGHEGPIWAVAVSPDTRYLITGSQDGSARLWNLQAEDVAQSAVVLHGHEGDNTAVAVSPDTRYLITGSQDDPARLWDLQAEDVAASAVVLHGHEGSIDAVAVSPDIRYLIIGSSDDTARLWDLQAKDVAQSAVVLRGHEESITAVAVSPDTRYLITGSWDTTARLWDLQAEDVADSAVVLRGHERRITAIAVSPDNRYLITGSADDTARLWTLRTEDLLAAGCRIAGRNLSYTEWEQYFRGIEYALPCSELPVHPSLLSEGRKLARSGDIDGAVRIFQRAVELDPGLKTEVTKWLLEQGKELAKQGKIQDAVAKFTEANTFDPELQIDPQTEAQKWRAKGLIEEGEKLARQGKVQETLAAYAQAQTLDPTLEISAGYWNNLCWFGSVYGYAAEVMDACERAVELAPESGGRRDSRGLARALTGDIEGAIEDFKFFVEWTNNEKAKAQRQQWVKALQAGENPFTPELLEELRGE